MKKVISIALLVFMLAACFAVCVSAEAPAEKVNAAIGADVVSEGEIAGSAGKHVWARIFDGVKLYDADDANTYCDTMFAANADKSSIIDGTYANFYNHLGETGKDDSKYYFYVTFELRTTYLLDSVCVYSQIFYPDKGVANMNCFDGFDLWASKDGNEYTMIHSVTDLICGKKWVAGDVDPNTAMYKAELATPFEAKYVTLCISQPRCSKAEFASENGLTAATNVQYFRLTELELLGTMTGELPVETTTEKVTTEAITTEEPRTSHEASDEMTTEAPKAEDPATAAPTTEPKETGCAGFAGLFGILTVLAVSAGVVIKKRF